MERIGIFDSGIGGLTTMSSIVERLGGGDYVYLADDKNAPFGNKASGELLNIGRRGVTALVNYGCKHIVIACNTMTASCKAKLSEEFSVNIIGTEPALKPAVNECTKVALLSTLATVSSPRLQELLLSCRGQVTCYPQLNLAGIIESIAPDWDIMYKWVAKNCHYLADYDGVVLGCTHYIHIRHVFSELFPHIKIYDGNDGVARRVEHFVKAKDEFRLKIHTTTRKGEDRYKRIFENGEKNKKRVLKNGL